MADDEREEWMPLHEAFQIYGEAIYGDQWLVQEFREGMGSVKEMTDIVYGRWGNQRADREEEIEEMKTIITHNLENARHNYLSVTPEGTREELVSWMLLFEVVTGNLKAKGTLSNSTVPSIIDKETWSKLMETDIINIQKGEVFFDHDNLNISSIKLSAEQLVAMAQSRRRRRLITKEQRGGASEEYEWGEIDEMIEVELQSDPPRSINAVAKAVRERLGELGEPVPSQSHLFKRVSRMLRKQEK